MGWDERVAVFDVHDAIGEWSEPSAERPRRLIDDLGFLDWADDRRSRARSRPNDKRHVCGVCVGDAGIAQFVRSYAESTRCDFCQRRFRSAKAAPLNDVIQYIEGCFWLDYDQPENVLPLDRESDSGFAGPVWDSQELAFEHLAVPDNLFDAIVRGLDPDLRWCKANPASFLPDQHLQVSWESFCEYVKHKSRFMFLRPDERGRRLFDEQDHSLVQSAEILDVFGEAVDTCGLITRVGLKAKLFRARRLKDGEPWFDTADELGPPPESDTGPPASRMSPAGIALTYVAFDESTALHETMTRSGLAAMGIFSPTRPLRLLDLRADRPVPHRSIFENVPRLARGLPAFVEAFREEIARPVLRDGREHIDYVPSQIVTEYVRRVFRTSEGERLDGVLYPSTRNHGGLCAALFVTSREVAGCKRSYPDETILRFRPRLCRRHRVIVRGGQISATPG